MDLVSERQRPVTLGEVYRFIGPITKRRRVRPTFQTVTWNVCVTSHLGVLDEFRGRL